ncbi:pentapeptide repeat-containing protein [Nostoc sp. UHCC 0251]|nr:pentapeptide repeat-containing protein [Nostoc sp. UHCC 0251]MEA5626521.1 pentapeptide repeat-containing protein [Nostoc sp. UHCC 0251]
MNIAVAFSGFGKKSFHNANFTTAILKSTDFRKANLIDTYRTHI